MVGGSWTRRQPPRPQHCTDGASGEARQRKHGCESDGRRSLGSNDNAALRSGGEGLGDGVVFSVRRVDEDASDRSEDCGEHGGKSERVSNGDRFVSNEKRRLTSHDAIFGPHTPQA